LSDCLYSIGDSYIDSILSYEKCLKVEIEHELLGKVDKIEKIEGDH